MNVVHQKPGTRTCGQAVVAMIAGVDLPKGCGLVGHARGTTTMDLRRALAWKCITCGRRLVRLNGKNKLPRRAILKLALPGQKGWHWSLWWDGQVYDPNGTDNWVIGTYSSYLEIK